ncbi:hypothetical protein [Nocardia sp. NPDC057455]|uniref:hypothetical protein n=1 Tax=Nocardia sp. NPDC057455 TaxID=3346138 RepID=UPI00366ACE7B
MNAQQLFEMLVLLTGSSAATAVITGVMGRRKVKIDATSVLSEVSIKQVEAMQTDLTEAKNELRQFKAALYEHQRWDAMVIQRLNRLGDTDIPNPPELWV